MPRDIETSSGADCRSRSRGDQGFTLIEVLIALVIFAVGLLALEALGIGAVRATGLGERNSRAAATANLYLEDALIELRGGGVPAQLCDALSNGDIVSRAVTISSVNDKLAWVTVQVTPEPRGGSPHPFSVTSHQYSPNPYSGAPSGSSCP